MNNINNTQNNVFLKTLLHYGGILFSLFSQCIIVSLTLKCVPVLTTNYVIPLLLIFFSVLRNNHQFTQSFKILVLTLCHQQSLFC